MYYRERELLAFTHIKKAGGTTLSHILRTNFLFRHCDVRVLKKESGKVFQTADMLTLLKINPFVRSIGGHCLMPFGNLDKTFIKAKFITLLRNPIKRYMSQYQYNVERLGYRETFETFLSIKDIWNRQVKTIAGSESLDNAIEILEGKFFLVGVVEEFDEFLILLKNKLRPLKFDPRYNIQNVGRKDSPIKKELEQNQDKYYKHIEACNSLDIELYNFVRNKLLAKEKQNYGSQLTSDVKAFQRSNERSRKIISLYIDYIIRKLYYRPRLNSVRKKNGI